MRTRLSRRRCFVAKARVLLVASVLWLAPGARGFAADAAAPPFFEGLGGLSRKVTTVSPEAQRYFDQGLAFMYAFNHDEAIRAFRRAAELDPSCSMAFWGVAIANGPHINNPVVPEERAKAAWEALKQAQARGLGREPGRASPHRGARLAVRPAPARGPQAARAGLRRRDAPGLGGLPAGRRRRCALRRGARRPPALGPLDAGRPAAAGHGGAPRDAPVRARASTRGIPSPTT